MNAFVYAVDLRCQNLQLSAPNVDTHFTGNAVLWRDLNDGRAHKHKVGAGGEKGELSNKTKFC